MSIYYMNSDGLSQLSSLIYNDFKNVNNTISEVYDKANSAYDLASSSGDNFIYYNLTNAKVTPWNWNLYMFKWLEANIPTNYASYKPHSVTFTLPSLDQNYYNNTVVVTGFVFTERIGNEYSSAQSTPFYNTYNGFINAFNISFRFTK